MRRGVDYEASNWNVVRLHFAAEDPVRIGRVTSTRSFDQGGYFFEQARHAVEHAIVELLGASAEANALLKEWRKSPTALELVASPYAWCLFQHGELYSDGVEAVMQRMAAAVRIGESEK